MTKVCTHAGLSRSENKLLIPATVLAKKERRDGELSLDEEGEGLSGGDGSLVVEDLAFLTPPRPDSSTYGVTADDRLLFILRCWCSFSSSSISTSFISSPTPSSGDIFRASRSIFVPKTRKSPAARKLVTDFGMRVGTAWPNMAERTVMVMSAEKAAVKTSSLSWRIAMRAATRKVLSPTSENSIMVKERRRECMGWMTALGSSSEVGREDLGFR